MYKLLLCWRYLRTRYIALASVISVTLGVATMIVVNSVMAGFSREMQSRIHGILSDITFESISLDGLHDADWHMRQIRKVAGEHIAGMSPTVHVPAMLNFELNGQRVTQAVTMIGIDPETYSQVGDFGKYLQHPKNRQALSFDLRDGGFDEVDHQAESAEKASQRPLMKHAGWPHRKQMAKFQQRRQLAATQTATVTTDSQATAEPTELSQNPFEANGGTEYQPEAFDASQEQFPGAVIGIALASYPTPEGNLAFHRLPGDDVKLMYPTIGQKVDVVASNFTIVDMYESKMSEYDASFVFVPLRTLQEYRGMINPQTQKGNFNSIQIKLKEGADPTLVRDLLRREFPPQLYGIFSWRDKQGPLLAAVEMEMTVLNLLLFLIIAVAGFGILAIFFMIVVEKTRDIGILKALGASGRGVMGIFLSYGLSLGVVGSGVGLILGLLFVAYINEIADFVSWLQGAPIFPADIYYFQKIPTIVEPWTVTWVVSGAVLIAVLASILPARRAARLQPVEALRYE